MLPSIPVRAVVHTLGLSPSLRIGFPVLICALIPLRWNLLPRLFSVRELRIMDSLTADNEVVLATLGGKPRRLRVQPQRINMMTPRWVGHGRL